MLLYENQVVMGTMNQCFVCSDCQSGYFQDFLRSQENVWAISAGGVISRLYVWQHR